MGRTQTAKALVVELSKRIQLAKQRKNELVNYINKLKESYSQEKISYARYVEIIHKHRDGKTIQEWIEYYNEYIKDCEKGIRQERKKIIKKNIAIVLFSVILIPLIIISLFQFGPTFVGFVVQEQAQEFSQIINLDFNESTTYEWQLENLGQLISAKISGNIEGDGEVKVYLNDLVIYDNSKTRSGITGEVVGETSDISWFEKLLGVLTGRAAEEPVEEIVEEEPQEETQEPIEETTKESYSEEEGIPQEDLSPSQEELSSEENITEETPSLNESYSEDEVPQNQTSPFQEEPPSEKNITEITNETIKENITEIEEPVEEIPEEIKEIENITIIQILDYCEETCDLSDLNLNKSSYTLRIEISNAKLNLDKIKYEIIPAEIPEEIIENITEVNITNLTTTQYQAVLGEPVKWKKNVELKEPGRVKVKLPKQAENINVYQISDEEDESEEPAKTEITNQTEEKKKTSKEDLSPSQGKSSSKKKAKFSLTGKVVDAQEVSWFKKIFNVITGRAVDVEETEDEIEVTIDENATQFEIEYETPAPYAIEQDIAKGKRIKIVCPETIHYENVLAFTNLSETLNIKNPSRVKIHWIEENKYLPVQNIQDLNNNGIYDYIEWIAPQLSNQTFEIIVITKAEHLDSNKEFISDIYDEVYQLDNIWSKIINDSEYVRVTFERELDSSKDITLYPRTISGTPKIQVYEIDGTELIAEFTSINDNEYNKVFLTNLVGTQDTFDLRVLNGDIEIEHIIDPPVEQLENPSFTNNADYWTLIDITYEPGTYQDTVGSIEAHAPRKVPIAGFATQDDYDDYLTTDTVTFSCYWKNTHVGNGNIQFFAEIAEDSTPDSWDPIWSTDVIYADNDWTSTGNVNVPITTDGTYRLRLRIDASAGAAGGSDELGWIDNCSLTREAANIPPTISGLPDVNADEDTGTNNSVMDLWDYSEDTEDPNADLTYAIESESSPATVDCGIYNSHFINCTPQTNQSGYSDVNVSVMDTASAKAYDVFKFTVNPINDPPWSESIANPGNINEDSGFNDNIVSVATINTAFRDIEDDYSLTNCTILSETNTTAVDCELDVSYNVDCTTQANQSGSNTVTLNCCDSGDLCTNMDSFTVTVNAVNDNPWNDGLSNPGNVNEDTGFHDNVITKATLDATFRDLEEDQVPTDYAISGQTGSSIINCVVDGEHNIDCTTQANQSGSNIVTVNLSDSGSLYTLPTFTITVDPLNDQPWVDGLSDPANLTFNSGLHEDIISSTDIDNNFRDLEEDQFPTSVVILSETHTEIVDCELDGHALDCTVQTNQAGTSTVTINYTDSGELYVIDSIDVSVSPDTILPTPSFGTNPVNTYNDSDGSITFELKCSDDDGVGTLQLWGNWTGIWHANQTNSTPINDTIWSIQVDNIPEGAGHIWGVWCNDSYGNENWTATNRTFTVDLTGPDLSNENANETEIYQYESFCLNITANDAINSVSKVYAEVWNTTDWVNYSMSEDGTSCDGTDSDNIYGVEIQATAIGIWNYSKAYANDTLGTWNSYDFSDLEINVTEVPNHPPKITGVYNCTDLSTSGTNEGPSLTYMIINFTAYDEEEFGNLNESSAQVNLSLAGEIPRINFSCAHVVDYGTYYANYTCNVTMWWWDAPGYWNINVSIKDNEDERAINNSKTFYVGATEGFAISPTTLNWTGITRGITNKEADNQILINNTGNVHKWIEVNATHLWGELNPNQALWAGNFTVQNIAGCEGTAMVYHSFENVTSASLPIGNFTINDESTGQEKIYFCLKQAGSELIAQSYSTDQEGSWTIRIVLVAVTFRRRKKKKKLAKDDKLVGALNLIIDELKEEYSLNKEEIIGIIMEKLKTKYKVNRKEILKIMGAREDLIIPINIFSKELGGLEAVTKYMKENLNMNYSEIAKELGRDERTIWTAYKKSIKKQPKSIKIKKTDLILPISIFKNEKLTILESLVLYLKKKQMKYSEIAELLDRDQRNIWTIYSRAAKK